MKRTLYIFDFDDTLVMSDAHVFVAHSDGTQSALTSHEFAKYVPLEGDQFDFTEFEMYPPNARPVATTFKVLKDVIANDGTENVIILTARGASEPVRSFLSDQGISSMPQIFAVGSANPAAKADLVSKFVVEKQFDHIHVFEDNIHNIRSIKGAAKAHGINVSHTLIKHGMSNEGVTLQTLRKLIKSILCEGN